MDDPPYTTPDEDPFNVRPLAHPPPRRRRSSMLDKWIHEQQSRYSQPLTSDSSRRNPSPSHPYLAYPELTRTPLDHPNNDSVSEHDYDLVPDDDIPSSLADQFSSMKIPDTPTTIRTKKASRMSLSPSSFRHINLVFRSPSTNPAPSAHTDQGPSRPSSRVSLFSRSNRYSTTSTITGRSTPHSTPQKPTRQSTQQHTITSYPSPSILSPSPTTTASSSKWRPSVLGQFGPANASQSQLSIQHTPASDTYYSPSRPSVSSSADTSNAHTSLTVPSAESCPIPASSNQKQVPFVDSVRSKTIHRHPMRHHRAAGSTTSGTSSTSLWSHIYPSSANPNTTSTNALSSTGDLSSPTLTSNTRSGSETLPRMFPFVYNTDTQVSARRGGNAFNGFYGNPSYRTHHDVDHDHDDDDDEDDLDDAGSPPSSVQRTASTKNQQPKKPHVVYSSGGGSTLSRMSLSNLALAPVIHRSRKKKKKLVVSGVAPNDSRKFEGVKRWCESFGEVRQIMRMPNGDLVVSFQSSEVADTVCRVRAKVFINGVGSVHLSWITSNKR